LPGSDPVEQAQRDPDPVGGQVDLQRRVIGVAVSEVPAAQHRRGGGLGERRRVDETVAAGRTRGWAEVLDPPVRTQVDAGRPVGSQPGQPAGGERGVPGVESVPVDVEQPPQRVIELCRGARAEGVELVQYAVQRGEVLGHVDPAERRGDELADRPGGGDARDDDPRQLRRSTDPDAAGGRRVGRLDRDVLGQRQHPDRRPGPELTTGHPEVVDHAQVGPVQFAGDGVNGEYVEQRPRLLLARLDRVVAAARAGQRGQSGQSGGGPGVGERYVEVLVARVERELVPRRRRRHAEVYPQHAGDVLLRHRVPVQAHGRADGQRPQHRPVAQRGGQRRGVQQLGEVGVQIGGPAQPGHRRHGPLPEGPQLGQRGHQPRLDLVGRVRVEAAGEHGQHPVRLPRDPQRRERPTGEQVPPDVVAEQRGPGVGEQRSEYVGEEGAERALPQHVGEPGREFLRPLRRTRHRGQHVARIVGQDPVRATNGRRRCPPPPRDDALDPTRRRGARCRVVRRAGTRRCRSSGCRG
jgi:hypothetical protein